MYQGAFQAQSNYPQSGLHQQGSQASFRGQQQPQNNPQNILNQPNGGGLLTGAGQAAPWVLQGQQAVRTVCEVQIAPISKRIYSEILDFIFLYFTKVLVFSIFYDDLERYSQLQYTLITDDNASLKDIEELLMQALVYRLIVFCI
ncbi:RDD [Desmophyllum pertusum]|uniref:RDD n=1 Tax=Desmophyllum pertusum TaxID=174260 RepID=A0A9X0CLA7_9CNID|nr:RDD [Desmophyllum pertusum]